MQRLESLRVLSLLEVVGAVNLGTAQALAGAEAIDPADEVVGARDALLELLEHLAQARDGARIDPHEAAVDR